MADTPQPGQDAPDFTLRDETNSEVSLSGLRGQPVVLVFYPFDFSGICEGEMCEIRDMWSDFEGANAKVLGISRDSIHAHRAWKEAKGLKHTLLADMKGEVATKYGAWNADRGFAERLTVVIDKDGKVAWTDRTENIGKARNQKNAVEALAALK
ncbi:MAG: redoxin domain-containing protein [Caulobacteraceae bacterium]|nr:redoxin domain-containing protein [Caulobacteraceae bacterium]